MIKVFALRSLLAMDGIPMPETALVQSIRLAVPMATQGDVLSAVRELESAGLLSGNADEITRVTTWTLTDRGLHKAKQL
jgi:hypothetical protein